MCGRAYQKNCIKFLRKVYAEIGMEGAASGR